MAPTKQLLETFLKDYMRSNPSLVEHSFVFCAIWAFGSALGLGDDGVDYRKLFSDWLAHRWFRGCCLFSFEGTHCGAA